MITYAFIISTHTQSDYTVPLFLMSIGAFRSEPSAPFLACFFCLHRLRVHLFDQQFFIQISDHMMVIVLSLTADTYTPIIILLLISA